MRQVFTLQEKARKATERRARRYADRVGVVVIQVTQMSDLNQRICLCITAAGTAPWLHEDHEIAKRPRLSPFGVKPRLRTAKRKAQCIEAADVRRYSPAASHFTRFRLTDPSVMRYSELAAWFCPRRICLRQILGPTPMPEPVANPRQKPFNLLYHPMAAIPPAARRNPVERANWRMEPSILPSIASISSSADRRTTDVRVNTCRETVGPTPPAFTATFKVCPTRIA